MILENVFFVTINSYQITNERQLLACEDFWALYKNDLLLNCRIPRPVKDHKLPSSVPGKTINRPGCNADLTPNNCLYGRPRTSTDVLSTTALRFFDQNREHPGEDFVVTLVQRVITTSYGCVTAVAEAFRRR